MRTYCCALLLLLAPLSEASRVKDLANIQGVRNNQLVGYGLVVGLEGTGDKSSAFTEQSFRSMLREFGIIVPQGRSIDIKNVAAVAISAELPPFSKPGQTIDVTVSSVGSAKSLVGGTLLMAPLKGADGQVYAVAQGTLLVSGFGAEGKDGSRVSVNQSSVGRIPNGATVERMVANPFYGSPNILLNLRRPDFTTAKRLSDAINRELGPRVASAVDATTVKVAAPKAVDARVDFLASVENVRLDPDTAHAKIVVNARTGTIVVGEEVVVRPVAVTHGSLTVAVNETTGVSQSNAFSLGQTTTVSSSSVQAGRANAKMFYFQGATKLKDLVAAVNAVGAAPGDLLAVLEALKEAGALQADLVVI